MSTRGTDFVRFAFEVSDLIPKRVGDHDAKVLFGLPKPNPRSQGESIQTSRCRQALDDLGMDVVVKQLQFPDEYLSELLAARFASVGMHTDDNFPRHCAVIPICGSGDLNIYTSTKRVTQVSIRRGIGVIFDNHRPHSFTLTSPQPVIAVLASFTEITRKKWNALKKNEIKACRL